MTPRLTEEIALLKKRFADLVAQDNGWVFIPRYPCPADWGRSEIPVPFLVPAGYPGTPPYAFYVPSGMRFKGAPPANCQDPASPQPPFPGQWAVLSWAPDAGAWRPGATVVSGSNLLNWVLGFSQRLRQGV